MPTPVTNINNMRKHLTSAERKAREETQQSLTREKIKLTPPKHIKNDPAAYAYWKSTLRKMKGITLLDDLDSEMLAMYCQILSRRDLLSEQWRESVEQAGDEGISARTVLLTASEGVLKRLEAQERLALSYAEKLGLTPSGRVRLAKRRAEEKAVDPDEDLYGDG